MLKIEYVPIDEIEPYEGNAKLHPAEQIEQIKQSIQDFGFNDPIAVWKDNKVIEGHGRLIAAHELKMKKVPVIRLDGLTDEQRRAYTLIHNKLTMSSDFDMDLLALEIESIENIDMEQFGFDMPELDDGGAFYGDERLRTGKAYNFDKLSDDVLTNDFWQIPIIKNDRYIPDDIIGFNYAKTSKEKNVGIHFYIDDYQFERIWNYPEKYIDVLREYECIISPDFSIYVDMPMPMKIWNTYRNRWLGAYYQSKGIKVIPNINWAYEDTYSFAFQGIPKGSIIARSTTSLKRDPGLRQMFVDGMEECIKRIEPSKILLYGGEIEFDSHGIEVIRYENKSTKRLLGIKNG